MRLQAIAEDKDGGSAAELGTGVGNDPPEVIATQPRSGDILSQKIVIKFELKDTSDDPGSIQFLVSKDGGGSCETVPKEHIVASRTTRLLPDSRDLNWDSAATLVPVDLDRVRVAIHPDDGLQNGAGELSYSPAFSIRNNSPPRCS